MTTKLHAICDSQGRPLNLFVTAGQVSDYIGARAAQQLVHDIEGDTRDQNRDCQPKDLVFDDPHDTCMRQGGLTALIYTFLQ